MKILVTETWMGCATDRRNRKIQGNVFQRTYTSGEAFTQQWADITFFDDDHVDDEYKARSINLRNN